MNFYRSTAQYSVRLGFMLLSAAWGLAAVAAEPRPAVVRRFTTWRQPPAPAAGVQTPPSVEPVSAMPAIPPLRPLSAIGTDIRPQPGDAPADLATGYFNGAPVPGSVKRGWADYTQTWEAPGLFHLPLYFEDVALERYGHSHDPFGQPVISAACFFGTVPLLPYRMGLEPPLEHVHALGYFRPGSCAPRMIYNIPLRADAALMEAGVITGLVLLLP